jgi:hypothetical protein
MERRMDAVTRIEIDNMKKGFSSMQTSIQESISELKGMIKDLADIERAKATTQAILEKDVALIQSEERNCRVSQVDKLETFNKRITALEDKPKQQLSNGYIWSMIVMAFVSICISLIAVFKRG